MQAIELQDEAGARNLRLVVRAMPAPGRRQVLVRMRAASLNYRDLEIVEGRYHTAYPLPLVPLSDGVGEVVALGADVTRVRSGERVCSAFWPRWAGGAFAAADPTQVLGGPLDGVLAEYVLLEDEGVAPAPAGLSDEEAATLGCAGVTAYHALIAEGGLRAGQTVLVQGTGGVSLFGLQIARAAGARVFVTSGSDAKLSRAIALGAEAGVNYATTPDWASAVLAFTQGRGVDHVLDVGGGATFAGSLRAVAVGGQISAIGYLGGSAGGLIDPLEIFRRKITVRGIPVGSRASLEGLGRLLEAGKVRPVVDRVFDWREAAGAFEYLAKGVHFGKVVLRWPG